MGVYNYADVMDRLSSETAIVSFVKANGENRVMLCTRDMRTASLFCDNGISGMASHDKRCNIKNGNIAVVDLAIGEGRSFNIDRVYNIEYLGSIDESGVNDALKRYLDAKHEASAEISMDNL